MRLFLFLLSFTAIFTSCSNDISDNAPDFLFNNWESLDRFDYKLNCTDDTIKILAIGNSYAIDALSFYFYDICSELNTSVMVGIAHISSCSLAKHLQNAITDAPAYYFRVQNIDGSIDIYEDCPLSQAISLTNWDIVTLQQVSTQSGMYETYQESLPALLEYVRLNTNNDIKIGWHQTWAYDKEHIPVAYNYNQEYMYTCIMNASYMAMRDYGFDFIVPCGTAIQNARNSSIGDNLNRDGRHLDLGIGRYTAACTWVESITGKNVIGVQTKPSNITKEDAMIAQISAHNAANMPFNVSYTEDATE